MEEDPDASRGEATTSRVRAAPFAAAAALALPFGIAAILAVDSWRRRKSR